MSRTSEIKTLCGTESVSIPCRCRKVHTVTVAHYDRIIVDCGAPYFIIRPQRFGPLKAIPHPGPNLTRQEYREKYGDEEAQETR